MTVPITHLETRRAMRRVVAVVNDSGLNAIQQVAAITAETEGFLAGLPMNGKRIRRNVHSLVRLLHEVTDPPVAEAVYKLAATCCLGHAVAAAYDDRWELASVLINRAETHLSRIEAMS